MDFEIIWSSAAIADLADIYEYLVTRDRAAADRVLENILLHIETLRTFPSIGPPVPVGGDLRWIVAGCYRVIYLVHGERHRVEILSVWHPSREAPPPF